MTVISLVKGCRYFENCLCICQSDCDVSSTRQLSSKSCIYLLVIICSPLLAYQCYHINVCSDAVITVLCQSFFQEPLSSVVRYCNVCSDGRKVQTSWTEEKTVIKFGTSHSASGSFWLVQNLWLWGQRD